MKIRDTARVILVNSDKKILLLKYTYPNEIFWLTPGGKIEGNETLLEAAKRELYEESGILNAEFIEPYTFYSEETYLIDNEKVFFKEHIFFAYIHNTEISLLNLNLNERNIISEARWWNIQEFIDSKENFYPKDLLPLIKKAIEYF